MFTYSKGHLIWADDWHQGYNKRLNGKRAGGKGSQYRRIRVGGETYLEHRIIFFMLTGDYPKMIDHVNRNKQDNRIENLRAVTSQQNNLNTIQQEGFRGVSKTSNGQRWLARIRIKRRLITIGTFNYEWEAAVAYDLFARQENAEFRTFNLINEDVASQLELLPKL